MSDNDLFEPCSLFGWGPKIFIPLMILGGLSLFVAAVVPMSSGAQIVLGGVFFGCLTFGYPVTHRPRKFRDEQ